jgi:hypothetical protein
LQHWGPAATIAAGSDCEDDLTFLNRAFAILVEHPPNAGAQRNLLQRMRNGDSRQHIISRIIKSDDFRDRVIGRQIRLSAAKQPKICRPGVYAGHPRPQSSPRTRAAEQGKH